MANEFEKQKERLTLQSDTYRDAVREHLDEIKSQAERAGRIVLVVGGSLFLAYSLVKSWTDRHSQPEEADENRSLPARTDVSRGNSLVGLIMQQIALFLIGVARTRLLEFLSELKTEGDEDENPE